MLQRKQERNTAGKPCEWRTGRKFPAFGILMLVLCLIISLASGATVQDTNASNASSDNVPVFNPSLNVTAALTPLETPPVPAEAKNVTSPTTAAATTIKVVPVTSTSSVSGSKNSAILTTGKAVNDQFVLGNGKQVSQEQKEAAAAGYRKIREAFLMQGTLATPAVVNSIAGGPQPLVGAAPVMDPGGIPHYFGPYPNYANSPMPKGRIASITVDNGGHGYTAPVVTIEDVYFTGTGATATATVAGGVITGITIANAGTGYSAPVVIITDATGSDAAATAVLGGPFTGGIRKFVDTLPGLNAAGANNLGQYIPVAIPDTTTYTGSDYYEIELGEYTEKLHSDLPPTTLRGYRQTNTADPAVSQFHNLGPLFITTENRPVRIKFTNNLPIGSGGNLFIPVDKTVMGAGMGPLGMNTSPIYYTENRAEIHLHGGNTPWISDGTPHQWITPAGEYTAYPEGASVANVPDMPDPGNGSVTLYYTNQQSARLMFYHDHSHGLTRLNVYAGEAGAYLLSDPVESDMINGTNNAQVNPGGLRVLPGLGIPLVIQDKTFVDNTTIAAQDPTWNWGTNPGAPMTGDLWYPHVYMPAQNPYDDSGVNAYGRWHYGPWFWPPTNTEFGPVANPYFGQTGEPPQMPGTPNPSMAMEAFMDTALVNGAIYPNLTVEPRAYRFRVLNAADDRFFNLQLYVADANVTTADGRTNTEVKMVPAVTTPGFPADWPTDQREEGVPDPATIGPSFIQIGTEGGFLPAPVVVPNQPITWVTDPTVFNAGNVDKHALLIAPAERADVIVDFSAYAGKTLILFNDAPAAFPARIPQYDYYTGTPDLTSTGGVPTIQPGYGPNTRTLMQIKVGTNVTTPTPDVTLANLQSVFARTAAKRGVFEVSQPPIIVPQVAYNSAYNATFTENNYARIADRFKNFTTISGTRLNVSFKSKAIQDEMGEAFDEFGRMSGFLGLQNEIAPGQQQLLLYGYNSPPTDIIMESLGAMSEPTAGDGTQIWKITHNGVDTHPIHWHLYNVQVLNRVGWDGFIRPPDANELGWKETLRVSPLEDTIVALRPVVPIVPFEVPDNIRPIDPAMSLGAPLPSSPGRQQMWFSPDGNPVTTNGVDGNLLNHLVNYGWEYVWHCHILAHEEMDMMHTQAVSVNDPGTGPDTLRSQEVNNTTTNTRAVVLAWRDLSTQETDWIIERNNISGNNWVRFRSVPSYSGPQTGGMAMAIDNTIPAATAPNYTYRVTAANVVGDDFVYDAPSVGFPVISRNSTVSNVNISQSVAPPGAASFTISPGSTGDAPFNVTFTSTSAGATGWSWDFGDGNYADDNGKQNPSHVYELPGSYTARLTAMTTGGNTTSAPTTITVTKAAVPAAPVASFNNASIREGAAPLTVTFNADASTSVPAVWATWRWSFGDGTFSSVKNVSHTYLAAGNYTVSLTATNLGGTNVMTRTGYVNVSNAVGTHIGVFRNATGNWYLDTTNTGVVATTFHFGTTGDIPVVGDWDGNGITDAGVFRPANGNWYLDTTNTGVVSTMFHFGTAGDIPVVGDWDANGITDAGVFRPSNGNWYFDTTKTGVVATTFHFGTRGDTPVIGNWTSGTTNVGVFRNATGNWYLDTTNTGVVSTMFHFGTAGDIPVVGDWDANGITDAGVFRPSNGNWYFETTRTGVVNTTFHFGTAGDIPVVGDWDGNGITDAGVFRPANGNWYFDTTRAGVVSNTFHFGKIDDIPVIGKWI